MSKPTPAPSIAAQAGRRISINVVVDDKRGHPITGLSAADFTLLDNKEPQKLLAFRAKDSESPGRPVHVIIVVDMVNTGFGEVAWERQELAQFLKEDGGKLANPTEVAAFSDSGLRLANEASQDGNVLLADFDKIQSSLRLINRSAGIYGVADMLQMSLQQMSQLAAYAATMQGHKMILVISPGWPLLPIVGDEEDMKQRQWVFNSIVHLTNGLRDGNMTLYCLDPFVLGRTNPFYYESFVKPLTLAKNAEYPDLALQVLAVHSGGEVLVISHDIKSELNIAVRDASASYILTFEAAPGDRADEYHAIEVHVDRPDVKVRTTAGYYTRVFSQAAQRIR